MAFAEKLKIGLADIAKNEIQWDCQLASYTSFGIGGPADALIVVESVEELGKLLLFFTNNGIAWCFIGKGNNLLVPDAGFAGVVMMFGRGLSEIKSVSEPGSEKIRLRIGAGCSLAKLINWCGDHAYSGLEFTAGIPGSIGGAVVMNAGAFGEEIESVIGGLGVMSSFAGVETLSREQLEFSYRFWENQGAADKKRIVLSVDLNLKAGDRDEIKARCRENLRKRKETQPKLQKNAGSFFKNPEGDYAGRLIEASGLKGKRYGGALISPVHANFLVNTGNATAEDVYHLMGLVTEKVKKDSGVQLFPEVHFL